MGPTILAWLLSLVMAAGVVLGGSNNASALFEAAALQIALIQSSELSPPTNSEYFDTKVQHIPNYDPAIQDYEDAPVAHPKARASMQRVVIPLLEQAAALNHSEALVTLGDIYTFGNYSAPTNYSQALVYYERAMAIQTHGHAAFMLGFMYSTGLFGEINSNPAKAQLYYQLGMEAGDPNALMAMAYRLSTGMGCPINCELSLVYYSQLARMGHQFLMNNQDQIEPNEVSFNVKIPDFIGGIYGRDVSETGDSVVDSKKKILYDFEQEYNIDNLDRKIVAKFFHALDEYDGHYSSPKNFTRAKELLEECTTYGETLVGYRTPSSLDINDRYRLSGCHALLGHMYFKGQGIQKDVERAYHHLRASTRLYNTSDALTDIGSLYEEGLVEERIPNPQQAKEYYSQAMAIEETHKNHGSRHSGRSFYKMARALIKDSPAGDIMTSPFKDYIVKTMQKAASKGDTAALVEYAEFIQSGYTNGITKPYSCYGTSIFMRVFMERLHGVYFPHLSYALEQLSEYNYKNALLGFSIAAEQGLDRAQVSAGWLLYQLDNFPVKKTKKFTPARVSSAMKYFQRASDQGDIDSTLFLGDLYFYGVESAGIFPDHGRAFNLYHVAADARSPHGCFNLAYMYEYGYGDANGTVEYHMAKRYYDLSLKYRDDIYSGNANQIPTYLALLKLRVKYYIWGKKSSFDSEQTSWLSAFKKLAAKEKQETAARKESEIADQRARQQHEGTNGNPEDEEFGIIDYFLLVVSALIFASVIVKTIVQQYRLFRNRRQANAPGDANNQQNANDEQPQPAQREGWNLNGAGVEFRRGNFEFQFMAL